MRKKIIPAFVILSIGILGHEVVNFYGNKSFSDTKSSIILANIEALAQDDDTPKTQKCTKAVITGTCYKEVETYINGKKVKMKQFDGIRIKKVEPYEVVEGSPIECKHDKITECKSGSFEG